MMSEEVWKKLVDFSNYEISSFGNVRNIKTNYTLTPSIKSGYLNMSLTNNNGDRKSVRIHRLVALSFIPNLLNKQLIIKTITN